MGCMSVVGVGMRSPLFSCADRTVARARCPSNAGTRAELYELQALPQLALIEWRDTCDGLVERDRQGQLSTTAEEFRMAVAQALGATACAGLGVAIVASYVLGQSAKRSI